MCDSKVFFPFFLKLCFRCISQKAESMKSRHLRENQEERGKLKQAARSLLQGITHLLELGEECMTEGTMSRVHSCSRLQAVLCRRKVSDCAFNKFGNKLAKLYDGHFSNTAEKPLGGFPGELRCQNNFKHLMMRYLCCFSHFFCFMSQSCFAIVPPLLSW